MALQFLFELLSLGLHVFDEWMLLLEFLNICWKYLKHIKGLLSGKRVKPINKA